MTARTTLKILAAVRRTAWLAFFACVTSTFFADWPFGRFWLWLPALLALAIGLGMAVHHRRVFRLRRCEAVEVRPPVSGRWTTLHSPADRTPSHGTHTYGQTYAIDVIAEPEDRPRPAFAALWPLARPARDFPAFGAPLHAVADATVVHCEDRQRDHLSRNSVPAALFMLFVEGSFRDIGGPRRVLGNHLVLDLGDGVHAVYGHLRRGSLTVRPGDRVSAGQVIAECGNSGNSSEPHLHFQLMDGPDSETAYGIPFRWRGVGVPANGEAFTADPAGRPDAVPAPGAAPITPPAP
ncbi:M23 family metallopeptidase [Streptomyces sp. NPDC005805]|uniref:M23 family metallopeptidase n=1 Tax=Streptomyces sp. NPDC005805 TaxID=3157068 RepID=UPI0033EE5FDD